LYLNAIRFVEKSWIYQGKPWLGIAIGVSLFSANNGSTSATKKSPY